MHDFFRLLFLVSTLALSSCEKSFTKDALIGEWFYENITEENVTVMDIGAGDFFRLHNNDSFEYSLHLAEKYGKGTWEFTPPHSLILHYLSPDTIRTFTLQIVGSKKLVFEENNRVFSFYR